MSLHLERQHDSEIRDGPCDMYLTGEISGNRLITHCQVPLCQALGAITLPHNSCLGLRTAPGWCWSGFGNPRMHGSCKGRDKIFVAEQISELLVTFKGAGEWARHATRVGVEDAPSKIWAGSEKIRKWKVWVLFCVEKWESKTSYSRTWNVREAPGLVLRNYLVGWIGSLYSG